MRWTTFIVIAALLLTLQSALAPALAIGVVRPDWMLVGAVFLGLYAHTRDAIIGAWVLGLCADLMTVERPGLVSLSYMLAALGTSAIREYVFRYWALTQFVLTFVFALCVQTVWMIYRRSMYGPTQSIWGDWLIVAGGTSVYTAAWAPLFHKLLLKLSGLLGISRPRYGHAGLRSMATGDV